MSAAGRSAAAALATTLFAAATAGAQTDAERIARATDLSIPSSPALALLGTDPASVLRPGFAEHYKLDLIVRDDGLVPDLALALRPVWTFAFANVDAASYRATSQLLRALSTVSLSIGTTQDEELRRMAWSISLNPLRSDPLMDPAYIRGLSDVLNVSDEQQAMAQRMATEEIRASRQIAALARDTTMSAADREQRVAEILTQLQQARVTFTEESRMLEATLTDSVKAYVTAWRERHWNETSVDIGVGRLYEYASDAVDELDFSGAGFGVWAVASSGFGTDRFLVSAMGRLMDVDGETRTFLGGNVRYGGPRFDAFVEYVFREFGTEDRHDIAYGGGYRLDESRSIEFGLRTSYDRDLDLRTLAPVVKLNWLIGKQRIEDLVLGRD